MKFFLEENDHELPNARWVSTVIHGHPNEDLEDNHMSLMVMQFGQFLGLVYHFLKYRISANTVVCKKVHKFGSVWCKMALGKVGVSLP